MSVLTKISDGLEWLGATWFEFKVFLEHSAGFSHDALHVLIGVWLQLLFAALLRTSIANVRPWLLVLALELLNELNDFRAEGWTFLDVQWIAAGKDLLLTMVLPTILLLAVRKLPALFRHPVNRPKSFDVPAEIEQIDGSSL